MQSLPSRLTPINLATSDFYTGFYLSSLRTDKKPHLSFYFFSFLFLSLTKLTNMTNVYLALLINELNLIYTIEMIVILIVI